MIWTDTLWQPLITIFATEERAQAVRSEAEFLKGFSPNLQLVHMILVYYFFKKEGLFESVCMGCWD